MRRRPKSRPRARSRPSRHAGIFETIPDDPEQVVRLPLPHRLLRSWGRRSWFATCPQASISDNRCPERRTKTVRASSPKSAARARNYRDKPEHEIDRDDEPDLIELHCGLCEGFAVHGMRKTPPGCKEQMEEEDHHHYAAELHDVDV